MTDIVDCATRSRMMSGISGVDTSPERYVRSLLHRRGFRFSLHRKDLPGKPDIVLPKFGAVILVHGCFWHRHKCHLFKWPTSNVDFWRNKLDTNAKRDKEKISLLKKACWKVLVVRECALTGKHACRPDDLGAALQHWLTLGGSTSELIPDLESKA